MSEQKFKWWEAALFYGVVLPLLPLAVVIAKLQEKFPAAPKRSTWDEPLTVGHVYGFILGILAAIFLVSFLRGMQ